MAMNLSRLEQLVNAADEAYRRARVAVFDRLPPGARVDYDLLDEDQRGAFDDLVIAEAELANFRAARGTSPSAAPLR